MPACFSYSDVCGKLGGNLLSLTEVPQAVCPIDSAAVKGITAQQVMYVRPGEWYRRPSMCFVVDLHVTTAVLIHLLGGHLLVDDTLASWADVLRRRYWYIGLHLLGRTPLGWRYTYTCLLVGHTCYDGDTSAGRTTPLGWRYTYTCLLVGHTCYDGDTSAGRTTPLAWYTTHTIYSMGRTSLRRRYTYTSYLGGGRLVWTYITCWAVIPFTADLPAWSDNSLVACVSCTVLYGEASQASKAT